MEEDFARLNTLKHERDSDVGPAIIIQIISIKLIIKN